MAVGRSAGRFSLLRGAAAAKQGQCRQAAEHFALKKHVERRKV
jgi:hypothetical protein